MAVIPVPFHIGIVVQDIDAAAAQLHDLLAVTWAPRIEIPTRVDTPSGCLELVVHLQYSVGGPPYLELVRRQPGSVWENLGLHHLGLWSNNPPSDSARFDALGCLRDSVMLDEQGNWFGGLYHKTPDGLRFELSSITTTGPIVVGFAAGPGTDPAAG